MRPKTSFTKYSDDFIVAPTPEPAPILTFSNIKSIPDEPELPKLSDIPEQTSDGDSSSTNTFSIHSTDGRSFPNVLKRISNIVGAKNSVRIFLFDCIS